MATDVISLVGQFLTPDLISKLASTLGLDRTEAELAIGAAVPGLLAEMSSIALHPLRAERLAVAVRQQQGILAGLTHILGGPGQSLIAERGLQLLTSVIGPPDKAALADALRKYSGIRNGASDTLLGVRLPVVMATIAQQPGGHELDGRTLAGFLASQRSSIISALPSNFVSHLPVRRVLGPPTDNVRTSSRMDASISTLAIPVSPLTLNDDRGNSETSAWGWVYWLIAVALFLVLLAYLLGPGLRLITEFDSGSRGAGQILDVAIRFA